ncbi:hypothetical protein Cni_G07954 [Canna indica]|uniref:Cyclin-like domain-containing protein n=1 Tax=Canna indica TaxID=4628 RepID=A0AAQ3K205_9LILI|nr:hypothetical protein Cni_G07954 [Canna indica]
MVVTKEEGKKTATYYGDTFATERMVMTPMEKSTIKRRLEEVVAPPASEKTAYEDNWFDRIAIHYLSMAVQATTGITNKNEGYESLVEAAIMISKKFDTIAQQELVTQSLQKAFPSAILKMASYLCTYFFQLISFSKVKILLPPSRFAREYFAAFTTLFFPWLIGRCEVRKSDVEGKTEKNVVYIPKCRFLESTSCVGMCTNLCKIPSQKFIQDSLGMPVYMVPNFEDMSCEMIFGQQPPTDDPALKQPCYRKSCSSFESLAFIFQMCLAMKKKGSVTIVSEVSCGRITRSRAAACVFKDKDLPPLPSISNPVKKQTQRGNSKRAAFDENSHVATYTTSKSKKRAVLKDVSNACSKNSSQQWKPAGKVQHSAVQRVTLGPSKRKRCSNSMASKLASTGNVPTYKDVEHKMTEEVQKVGLTHSKHPCSFAEVRDSLVANKESIMVGESLCTSSLFEENHISESHEPMNRANNGGFGRLNFIDIDTDHANPQKCCTYASEIYANLRVAELIRRPVPNYIETLQQDITQSMRGILIDWLVEVSEEFKLVSDTLYLTVYMVDRFLSQNHIERRRLQLLGITCMLIASKYEEICTPPVKEFCFITDDTYTNVEVRSLALDYMANYLAELTLVEYSFIKFLPSLIAASAVFLARWTLDQSNHPWVWAVNTLFRITSQVCEVLVNDALITCAEFDS